jgi:hypothetical protein
MELSGVYSLPQAASGVGRHEEEASEGEHVSIHAGMHALNDLILPKPSELESTPVGKKRRAGEAKEGEHKGESISLLSHILSSLPHSYYKVLRTQYK